MAMTARKAHPQAGYQAPAGKYMDQEGVLIPNSAADLIAEDIWLEEITLTNVSGGAVTVTILDKQSTPRALFDTYSIASKATVSFSFKGCYMKGGINWVASAASAIVARLHGRTAV